jgi:hypothetical protein
MALSAIRSSALSIATSGSTNSLTISFFDKFFNLQTNVDVSSENIIMFMNSSAGLYNISYTAPDCTTFWSTSCPIPSISNTYTMTFSVTRSGSFSLWIASFLSGRYLHLRGSPFSLLILPGIACGSLSSVSGPGLTIATAGVIATYQVALRDSWGNIPDPNQNFVRSFVNLSGTYDVSIQELNFNSFKITKGGANLLYAFSSTVGGLFATFWNNDFSVRRTSSVTNLDFSRMYDSNSQASTNFASRFAGFLRIPYSGTFTFSANLAVSTERVKLIIDHVTIVDVVSAMSPRSSIFQALRGANQFYYIEVEYISGSNQNSRLSFLWSNMKKSTFDVIPSVCLYYAGAIDASPFSLLVMPGPVHTTHSNGTGGFYSIITAGIMVTFTVTLKDAYNNIAGNINDMFFDISAADVLRTNPAVDVVRSSCLDKIDFLLCPMKSAIIRDSDSVISVDPSISSTGAIRISFSVTKSGKYAFRSRLFRSGGLASEYYNTMEFKTWVAGFTYNIDQLLPLITRVEESPSNDWGLSSPYPGVIPVDQFSVRYRGHILGPCSCAVEMVFSSDFGFRVYANGGLLIDQIPSIQSQVSVTVDFIFGSLLPIVIEYVHNSGPSVFKVAWASSNWSLTEIPSSSFYFDVSIGKLSQFISVLPRIPIWSVPILAQSLSSVIITAGIPISFLVSSSDSYGNSAYSFDSTKVIGKWNFPLQNISGIGTASVVSETSTEVTFSVPQSLPQGTRLYGIFSNNEHFFIGVLSATCSSSSSCNLTRASQIIFSHLPFYYIHNAVVHSCPLTITQLGDFASPFNGLTATYFSPHTSKFSLLPSLNPVKVLCQKGSFFDAASCDQTLDFSNPISNGIISGSNTFSVRWSGLLLTQNSGIYTLFGITSSMNEFSSLRINGTNLFSEVGSGSFATISVGTAFNTFHDIVVEYQKMSSSTSFSFQLKWKGPNIGFSIIPSKFLFPLGSRFVVTSSSTLAHENISQISIGSVEEKGLSSTFYRDILGKVPIASLGFNTLELTLVFFLQLQFSDMSYQ